jgi:hypothetical protein
MTTPTRRFYSDGRAIWFIDQLWRAAADLPTYDFSLEDVPQLDQVLWFSEKWGRLPTCRAVIDHCVRINNADLSFPIIVGPTGEILDGMHRIAKALASGHRTLRAVRLPALPPADEHLDPSDPRYEA